MAGRSDTRLLQIEEKVAKEGWSVAPSDTMTVVTLPEKCAWHAVEHCAVVTLISVWHLVRCVRCTWQLLALERVMLL